MRTNIQRCDCGKVRKIFNSSVISSWRIPNESLSLQIQRGDFIIDANVCDECKSLPGNGNKLLPVTDKNNVYRQDRPQK